MKSKSALLTLVLFLAACGTGGESTADLTVTIDSAGPYRVIRSNGTAPQWRATLAATVGTDSGGPAEFGSVRSVLLDPNGSLYVVDPSYVQLSVFDSTGVFQRKWGRKGAGPGEYANPYSIAWLHDSLVLLDPGNTRITVYGPDAGQVRQWQAERITGGQVVRLYRTPPSFWVYGTRRVGAGLEGLFVRYTSAGPTDTLPQFRMPEASSQAAICTRPDRGISFFTPPFGPVGHVIPTAAGERAVAVSTKYRIAFLGLANDTLRVLERSVTAATVSDSEWTAATEEWRKFHQDWPTAVCDKASFERPATKPLVHALVADDAGQLWVEVLTASGVEYDVFGADGALRATVTGLPPSGGIDPSIVGGRIALVVPDTSGINRVQVFRYGPH